MSTTSPQPARGCPVLCQPTFSPFQTLVLVSIAATALAAGGCASGALQPDDPVRVTNPRTIGKTQLVGERIPIGIPEDYKPCIARLPGGELLLVAFHAPRQGGVPEEYAFLYRSGDGGRTWSRRRRLEVLGREPYLSVTSDGTIFVSTHLLPKARGNREGYTQSFLYRSTDGGDHWEGQRIGFQDLKGMEGPDTVVTGRNVLELDSGALVFAVGGKGGHEFLWRSNDGGETWDKSLACRFGGVEQSTLPFPILGEAFLCRRPPATCWPSAGSLPSTFRPCRERKFPPRRSTITRDGPLPLSRRRAPIGRWRSSAATTRDVPRPDALAGWPPAVHLYPEGSRASEHPAPGRSGGAGPGSSGGLPIRLPQRPHHSGLQEPHWDAQRRRLRAYGAAGGRNAGHQLLLPHPGREDSTWRSSAGGCRNRRNRQAAGCSLAARRPPPSASAFA